MPRSPRLEYAGAFYHVMNRGNQKRSIFRNDLDRRIFLETLAATCRRTGWGVHSFALMPNHYHLLIETPRANLVRGMQWLNSTYTLRFNSRHRLRGHLFQGRYKALVVEGQDSDYFLTVADYIHLNPWRARIPKGNNEKERWEAYWCFPWNSAAFFGRRRGKCPSWLIWERLFGVLNLGKDTAGTRCQFREGVEARWREVGQDERWQKIRRGWYLGAMEFRDDLLERLEKIRGQAQPRNWSGELVVESEEVLAERLCQAGLRALNKSSDGLNNLTSVRKLDWRKQWLAWWIFTQSRVTLTWVAKRLAMGHDTNVSLACRWAEEQMKSDRRLKKLTHQANYHKSKD